MDRTKEVTCEKIKKNLFWAISQPVSFDHMKNTTIVNCKIHRNCKIKDNCFKIKIFPADILGVNELILPWLVKEEFRNKKKQFCVFF